MTTEHTPDSIVDLSELPRGRVLWLLFYNFFKIALFVVGGGYAIMLAAEDVFIRKLRWVKADEITDIFAVSQSVPGLMAGNAAIYIGYRAAGKTGALVALLGVGLPSFVIITLISLGFSRLPMGNPYVNGAFIGVRSALCGLVLAALCRTWRKSMAGGAFPYLVVTGCIVGICFFHLNPAWLLLGSVLGGIAYFMLGCRGAAAKETTDA